MKDEVPLASDSLAELCEAAEQGSVDAMEQLGTVYAEGTGAPLDKEKAAACKAQAFGALRSWPLTQIGEVVERSHGLLYGTNGLCTLLKSLGRPEDARQASTDFLKVLRFTHQTSKRDCALYKAEALLDLADLSYDGRPSDRRLKEAEGSARKALAALAEVADDQEGRFQLVRAHEALSGCLDKRGDLDGAIEELREASQTMDELAQETGSASHRGKSAGLSLRLGMLYKRRARPQVERQPSRSATLMEPAASEFVRAVGLAREAVAADPTVDNRKMLASALLQSGRLTKKRREAVAQIKEAVDLAKQLQEETADGSCDALVSKAAAALDRRRSLLSKLLDWK
jgi:tetratricopeptide (TPR) repeat protein